MRSDPFIQPAFRKGLCVPGEEDSNIADALRENSIPAGSCEFKLLLAALNASIHQISKQRYLQQSPVANRAPHSDETLSSDDPAGDYDSDEIRSIAVASGEGHVALKKSRLVAFLNDVHPNLAGREAALVPMDESTTSGWLRVPMHTEGPPDLSRESIAYHGTPDRN